MPENPPNLGKLINIHATAPIYMQRAVFIAVLSFVFFLGVMFAFYLLQSFIYFLLASAFLIVYLVTMFSLLMQRRNVLRIYENGMSYRKFLARWEEIEAVKLENEESCEIRKTSGEAITISRTLDGFGQAVNLIKSLAETRR